VAPGKSAAPGFPCGKSSAGHDLQLRLPCVR
jgi:hypothetical protein